MNRQVTVLETEQARIRIRNSYTTVLIESTLADPATPFRRVIAIPFSMVDDILEAISKAKHAGPVDK